MSYNGWRNRETWLVNLWYNPERKSDLEYIKEDLDEQYDNLPNGALKDMIDLQSIDWRELEEALDPDEEEADA
jgi:hypothetical protein